MFAIVALVRRAPASAETALASGGPRRSAHASASRYLRDRASCHAQSLFGQKRGEFRVGERTRRVFGRDQLFEQRSHRRCGARTTRFGRELAREEVLELEHAARRRHILVVRHAAHGGFVQVELRQQCASAPAASSRLRHLEKRPLFLHDRFGDSLDRNESLLHAAQKPRVLPAVVCSGRSGQPPIPRRHTNG